MRFQGIVYRAHKLPRVTTPLSGKGAQTSGGRFNPLGIPAFYTGLTQTVALAEYNQGFPHRPQPTALCAYEVDCEDVLDLTDPVVRATQGIAMDDLACGWMLLVKQRKTPPSWTIAEQLIKSGVAAIIVPSFASNAPQGGKNLVFWNWGNTPPHKVTVIDDNDQISKIAAKP
jgi:RES domain-containing protein